MVRPSFQEGGGWMDAEEIERSLVERSAGGGGPELAGPVHVLERATGADGGSTYHVSASHLVPVDEDDPDLAGVSIAVPVTADVQVDGDGAIIGIDVPDDPSAQREARAFTRNLIARGAVSGLAQRGPVRRGPGPPTRPTHEVTVDELGRRVIRRTGFTAAAAPSAPAATTAPAPTIDARPDDSDDQHHQKTSRGGTR
jgi:hypothetical protein